MEELPAIISLGSLKYLIVVTTTNFGSEAQSQPGGATEKKVGIANEVEALPIIESIANNMERTLTNAGHIVLCHKTPDLCEINILVKTPRSYWAPETTTLASKIKMVPIRSLMPKELALRIEEHKRQRSQSQVPSITEAVTHDVKTAEHTGGPAISADV